MKVEDVVKKAFAMPLTSPSFPRGPHRFVDREYLVITYSTDVTSTQEQIIQIEYTVRPDISVVALRDENGTFGIDVVRRQRFK